MKLISWSVFLALLLNCLIQVDETEALRGRTKIVRSVTFVPTRYCICWYGIWGCSYWLIYQRSVYTEKEVCADGWSNNKSGNCNIAICNPSCGPGTCISPNQCKCPSTYTGRTCGTATCSYLHPCYPGTCANNTDCTCAEGFTKTSRRDGCTTFRDDPQYHLAPIFTRSNVTISQVRRTNGYIRYMFTMEGTGTTKKEFIWSNQKSFNKIAFHFEALFEQPENVGERPLYVHESKLGVVRGQIMVNHTKHPRDNGRIRTPASNKQHTCSSSFSKDYPAMETAKCEIIDDEYMTSVEHNDWVTITFQWTSGGFMKLTEGPQRTKYFEGLQDIKEVEFRFDFVAPRHCSEPNPFLTCPRNEDISILRVNKEFTEDPIEIYWNGWYDNKHGSGVVEHYVEIFKLEPDPHDRLVEKYPINPNVSILVPASVTTTKEYPKYIPSEPGMYSILMETRDMSNNSRTARRFVLYDNTSEITIKNGSPGDGLLYVSSAVAETGYMWQTTSQDSKVQIDVNWEGHFINKIHEDGKLLNEILQYPIQFADIEADGILFSRKYVSSALDDNEGTRTRKKITNFHGIIKFEIAKIYTKEAGEPPENQWDILTLTQRTSFSTTIGGGSKVSIWIRATDSMGHKAVSYTTLHFDDSAPVISMANSADGIKHSLEKNVQNGTYKYTSRVAFAASDDESGVHKLSYTITISTPNKQSREVVKNSTHANTGRPGSPLCNMVLGKCFLPHQILELDNCWLTVNKEDLDMSKAIIEVTAYNQALLKTTTSFTIDDLTSLKGLEKYSGPTNVRIENQSARGFRVAWDLPKQKSCYDSADIVLIVTYEKNGESPADMHVVNSRSSYFDVLMDPNTEYKLSMNLRTPEGERIDAGFEALTGKTPEEKDKDSGPSIGLIAGIAGGILAVVGLAIGGVVFAVRRGYIHPQQRAASIRRRVSKAYRHSRVPKEEKVVYVPERRDNRAQNPYVFDVGNRQSEELYIYGGMDMDAPQIWHIDRGNVTFEDQIKEGRFANIYKATLRHGQAQTVVAKTLKASFTPNDELLMKAKINFTGSTVGDHPNVLKFVGAVVNDPSLGPFIIYEYCELGTLRDYLVAEKDHITYELQDNLFRFGRGIAMGMEFLASKGIVHRRLAARNILLTFLKDVKISGFGPQPVEDGDAGTDKQERIPIKWMAPECHSSTKDATEKSDVWSYGVVLWEIFSMGNTPYADVRSRDLNSKLKKGVRLPKPELCDDTWYEEMNKCWSYKQTGRPSFTDLRIKMDEMFTSDAGEYYYQS